MITKYFHLKDTIWSMILPYIIMPWHVFLMKGFFSDIPTSLIEAAKIDGASEVRTFFKVILPSPSRRWPRWDCSSPSPTGTTGGSRCCMSRTPISPRCNTISIES